MNILTSLGRKHLPGHKELTAHREVISYDPEKVYLPAVDSKGAPLGEPISVGAKVKCGTVLGIRPDFQIPVTSSVSGEVTKIEKLFNAVLGRPSDFFVIQNDKKYEVETIAPLAANPTRQELIEQLKKGGIVGLGGAGFPAYIKYKTESKVDHILINDVECEPYLTTDMAATRLELEDVIYAAKILVEVTGAKSAVLAIKKTKVDLIALIREKIEGKDYIELKTVPDVYPAGYERTLVRMIFKREYKNLPIEAGIIVNNFQTVAAMAKLFRDGRMPDRRIYTFVGDGLSNSANVLAPAGTLIKDVIGFLGGYAAVEEVMLVCGGPMMGKAIRQEECPLQACGSGVLVYDVKKLQKSFRNQPCLRCGSCVDHCPVNLQPILMREALAREDYVRCRQLGILSCLECSLCSAVCPSHINLAMSFGQGKMLTRLKAPEDVKK